MGPGSPSSLSSPATQPATQPVGCCWCMICQCQSGPGAGGAAKAVQSGNEIARMAGHQAHTCGCPFVMDSWPLPAPGHAFREEEVGAGELQSGIIVRGRMQPPRLLHTSKSRHTCSGYGSRRSPEPCSCRSDPWPCIRGLAGPGPLACPLATHAANMAVRSMFICPRRDSSTDPDFYSKCRMLVLWPPKQVTRSTNKKGNALAKAHVNSPKSWIVPR